LITMHQIDDAVESLPICEEPAILSVHFTSPKAAVVYNGPNARFDIAADDESVDSDTGESLTLSSSSPMLKVAHSSRISISYDVAKLDDQTAA
jgi:L-2-hydroxyglutarate oxidase LhgO